MPSLFIGPMKELIATTTHKIESPKAKVANVVEKHAKMAEKELKEKPKKAPKEAKPKKEFPFRDDKNHWFHAGLRWGSKAYAESKGIDLMKYHKHVLKVVSLTGRIPTEPPANYPGGVGNKDAYEKIPPSYRDKNKKEYDAYVEEHRTAVK